jgi:hypothetical protein
MASQTTDPPTAGHDRPNFVVERVQRTAPGRLEVRGRWYGIRGRRFFRPELILLGDDGERRWLAELDQKPWAAVDGEQWLATFALDEELDDKAGFELSVAPDITVRLADGEGGQARRRRRPPSEAILRAPRVRSDTPPSGPTLTERAQEIERLNSRLTTLGQELERERERRTTATADLQRERTRRAGDAAELERERERRAGVAQELEDERSETRRLRSQVGRLKGELDLARTSEAEGAAAAADLDAARQELDKQRALTDRLRTQLTRERAAAAAPQTQEFRVAAQAASTEPGTPAPPTERPPRGDRRRGRDESAGGDRRRGRDEPPSGDTRPGRDEPPSGDTRRGRDEPAGGERAAGRDEPAGGERRPQRETPSGQERQSREAQTSGRPRREREAQPSGAPRREPQATPRSQPPGRSPPAPRPERPLNPSLRYRTNWLGRLLALVMILAVLAAIYLVIKTTVTL